MDTRSVPSLRSALAAGLTAAFILLSHSTGWAQSLTPSANPPAGVAGVNNVYLTGSGFPSGLISNATARIGTSCAPPAIASAPAQVATIGVLRRFQFQIPASLAPGSYKVWVTGTAGTATFNTLNTPSCSTFGVVPLVRGTASLGAAIGGASVTLVDVNGNTVSGTTAADGSFALSTQSLTPPFLVKIVTASQSGNFPAGTTFYSVSADGSNNTTINVSVLTDLILRSYYSAQGINPDNAFANPTGDNAAPTPQAVESISNLIIPAVQFWLNGAGITLTGGVPVDGALNLISSPFLAFPPGVTPPAGTLDSVLHEIVAESVGGNGGVTGVTITGGVLTETISPTYPGGDAMAFSETTTNTTTGGSSSALFSGVALTPSLTPLIDGINAALTQFRNIVNSKGAALTGTDLLPFYQPDYLNNAADRIADSNSFAQDVLGATINSLALSSIKSVDFVNNVADVFAHFDVTFPGGHDSGEQEWIFKLENGVWALYGNQKFAETGVAAQSRTFQGGHVPSSGQFMFAFVNSDVTFGVTGATVSGAFPIWGNTPPGTTSTPLGAQPLTIQNGVTFKNFLVLSLPLTPAQFPPVGSTFTISLTTNSLGNPSYPATTNAFTTENTHFNGISTVGGTGPLSSILGQTKTYSWTLPTTFTVSDTSLFYYIFDGPFNSPTSHSCSFSSNNGGSLTPSSTSDTITFPTDMSVCGGGLSGAIKAVQVFQGVDGVNGEQIINNINYPF
jgi:hypothetical protein